MRVFERDVWGNWWGYLDNLNGWWYLTEHISCNLIRYNYCNVNYLAQLNIAASIKMTHQFQVRSTSAKLLTEVPSVNTLAKSPLFLTSLSSLCTETEPSISETGFQTKQILEKHSAVQNQMELDEKFTEKGVNYPPYVFRYFFVCFSYSFMGLHIFSKDFIVNMLYKNLNY